MSIYPTVRFNPYVITPLLRLEGSLPLAPGWWLEGRAQTPLDGGTPDPVRALLGWHKRDAGPWLATAWLASDGQPGLLGGTWRPHAGAEIGWDGWDGLLALRGRLGGEIVPAGRTETQAWGEVYLPGTGLTLKAGWGRFPLGDSAPFIGLRRTVPRGWLEVSAARSDTYGTRLALGVGLDLGPLPAKAPKPLRLRFPGAFSYTYAATGYVAASPLEPGSRLGDVRQRLAGIWLRETLDAPD